MANVDEFNQEFFEGVSAELTQAVLKAAMRKAADYGKWIAQVHRDDSSFVVAMNDGSVWGFVFHTVSAEEMAEKVEERNSEKDIKDVLNMIFNGGIKSVGKSFNIGDRVVSTVQVMDRDGKTVAQNDEAGTVVELADWPGAEFNCYVHFDKDPEGTAYPFQFAFLISEDEWKENTKYSFPSEE